MCEILWSDWAYGAIFQSLLGINFSNKKLTISVKTMIFQVIYTNFASVSLYSHKPQDLMTIIKKIQISLNLKYFI